MISWLYLGKQSSFLHWTWRVVIGRLSWRRKIKKTAFACHRGLFEFNVCSFPRAYVWQDCEDFSTAYLDDIMIFSQTLEEHLEHISIIFDKLNLEHISIIFDKLRQHNLKLKLKKCSFLKSETHYTQTLLFQFLRDVRAVVRRLLEQECLFKPCGIDFTALDLELGDLTLGCHFPRDIDKPG